MDSFLFVNGGITQVCFFLYKENYTLIPQHYNLTLFISS